jgi:ADP-ribose pyrophosphatase
VPIFDALSNRQGRVGPIGGGLLSGAEMLMVPKLLFRGRKFSVVSQNLERPGGGFVEREWVRHPGAVTIVPLVGEDRVCLIRNRRVAVGKELIELPAGTRDGGELPEETARRELLEETGYRAGQLRKVHEFFMSPGILDERMYLFLATGLEPGPAAREPGEQIENWIVPWEEAVWMAVEGRIEDAKTLVGILCCDALFRREKRLATAVP